MKVVPVDSGRVELVKVEGGVKAQVRDLPKMGISQYPTS